MVQKSMTPKNKKKIRKQITEERTRKHTSPERRVSPNKISENDEPRERKFSRNDDRTYQKEDRRRNPRNERDFDRNDTGRNNRREEDENRKFGRKEPFQKNYDKRPDDNKKPFERKSGRRFEEERKPYEKRTSGDFEQRKRPLDQKEERRFDDRNPVRKNFGEKRFDDRNTNRRNFDDRKQFNRNFKDERQPEKREYRRKANFEEDRNSRFIDDESPLKKSRTNTDNRKYSSYEHDPGKTKRNRPVHIDEMRLNKYLAHCGVAARRKADELIAGGSVKVNGKIVREMGYKVMPGDEVRFKGKLITPEEKVYILINKPKDFITTAEDDRGRKTILQLIEGATDERVYPVGRLDRNTTGVLLLTNDGEMAQQLSHPSFGVKKVYAVELDKPLTPQHLKMISEGIQLEDGIAMVDEIAYADAKNKKVIGIMLHVGKNRIVRRIFEHLGYQVEKLDRTLYAGLDKKNLERGRWRFLNEKEITLLKRLKK